MLTEWVDLAVLHVSGSDKFSTDSNPLSRFAFPQHQSIFAAHESSQICLGTVSIPRHYGDITASQLPKMSGCCSTLGTVHRSRRPQQENKTSGPGVLQAPVLLPLRLAFESLKKIMRSPRLQHWRLHLEATALHAMLSLTEPLPESCFMTLASHRDRVSCSQ